jgi:hypothetical protein
MKIVVVVFLKGKNSNPVKPGSSVLLQEKSGYRFAPNSIPTYFSDQATSIFGFYLLRKTP